MIEKIKINNEKKTEDEIILEEALTPEYDFDFEIGTNETNEEYLFRLNSFVHKERFEKKDIEIRLNNDDYTSLYNLDKSFFGRDNYSFVYEKAYSILIKHEEKEVFNNDKNKEVINLLKLRIDKNVRILNNKLDSFYSGVKYFNDTNQSRDFFPDGDYENDNISCADSLMAVEFNSKESERYLKNKLDNKNICILGGGKSLQDLIENRNIIPKSIINVDPYLEDEFIARNINNNYKLLKLRADDKYLYQKMKSQNIDEFDEIWASFSVPYYNITTDEIDGLFDNIDRLLKEGGNCRITPLSVQNNECNDELLKILTKLNNTSKFNFVVFGNTLLIHKLKKGK